MATGGKHFGKEPVSLSPVASEARPPREDTARERQRACPPTRPVTKPAQRWGWRAECRPVGAGLASDEGRSVPARVPLSPDCKPRANAAATMMHNATLYLMNRPAGLKEAGGTV